MDPEDLAIVISVVYDGPPEAGKTTSVRALARSFGREVYTPEERDGRTVYFDWLEHTGGRFDGAPIRCQIASVPGQRRWTRRRGHFLDRADVVVFVGDTTARGWPTSVARLRELRAQLDARPGAPVGLVFQANKRDLPDAVALDVVRETLAPERIAVIESVAHDGTGVREAFVFAVRLALDRVRAEQGDGAPPRVAGTGGEELYDLLRQIAPEQVLDESVAPIPPPVAPSVPRAPSAHVPSGCIWPPVDGRVILRDAVDAASVRAADDGGWIAEPDGWQLRSAAAAVFAELDAARTALLAWARLHASVQAVLSRRRCIVLSETGDGAWRLWQIVRREPSLRDLVRAALAGDAAAVVRALAIAGRLLLAAQAAADVAAQPLPCTLDSVGASELDTPVHVGLVPHPGTEVARGDVADAAHALVAVVREQDRDRAELAAAVRRAVTSAFAYEGGARLAELMLEEVR